MTRENAPHRTKDTANAISPVSPEDRSNAPETREDGLRAIERERLDLLAGWRKAGGSEDEFIAHWPVMRLQILEARARILASPWNTPKGTEQCHD